MALRNRGLDFKTVALVSCLLFLHVATTTSETLPSRSQAPDSTADGPHVLWESDSVAAVIYFCDGTLQTQRYPVVDTLRFDGWCHDSGTSYLIPRLPASPDAAVLPAVSRILAVSDLHGDYSALTSFLHVTGVVDSTLHWSWGDGHIVIDGDVADRGDRVTECFWLIYRLQQEAQRAGGAVHMLLGNHEKMVMRGDLRYVAEKYTKGVAHRSRIHYDDLFGPEMELGRWLRRCNTALRIGEVLFIHAGIPPRMLSDQLTPAGLNDSVRALIDLPSAAWAVSDFPRYLFSGDGPLWYRGFFEARDGHYPRASSAYIDSALALTGARRIVVGHSEQDSVRALYDGRVIAIDVPIDELGGLEGVLLEADRAYRVRTDGSRVPLE